MAGLKLPEMPARKINARPLVLDGRPTKLTCGYIVEHQIWFGTTV